MEYRTIKIRIATYRRLKVRAALTGETLMDLIDRLVQAEPTPEMHDQQPPKTPKKAR